MKDYVKSLSGIKSKKSDYELSLKEDIPDEGYEEKRSITAEWKGSIIHKILQKDNLSLSPEEVEKIIRTEFDSTIPGGITSLSKEISRKLSDLNKSEIYNEISSYKKAFNEYEIYVNDEDYFLHGIIDKLIIEEEKAVIIDYKTNSIKREEICDRASLYFHQLKFYSYIVSRFFKKLTSFELRLIFINFPGEDVKEIISLDEVKAFGEQIREMVHQIRQNQFNQNLSHCQDCNFAAKNSKCIVGRA